MRNQVTIAELMEWAEEWDKGNGPYNYTAEHFIDFILLKLSYETSDM